MAWRSEGRVRVTRLSPVLRRPWGAASAEGMAPCGRGVPGGRCVPDSPAGFVYPASRCPRVLPRRASSQGPLGHPRVTRRRRAGSDSLASLAQWSHRACPSPRVSCFAKCMLSREDAYLVKDFFFFKWESSFRDSSRPPRGRSLLPVSGCTSGTVSNTCVSFAAHSFYTLFCTRLVSLNSASRSSVHIGRWIYLFFFFFHLHSVHCRTMS